MSRKWRWYRAIPEATTVVDCGGERHRITWRRGKVVVEAHDLTAERALLAFGGAPCPCMQVLEVWTEQFRMAPDLFAQMPSWLGDKGFLVPTELGLPRRLGMVLTWERAWRFESWLPTRQARLLGDELKARALPPLREHVNAWKAKTGVRIVSGCQVGIVPPTEPAALGGTTDGLAMKVAARLPPRWVVDVWARGISTVDGAFVVGLTDVRSADDLSVVAGRWEPTGRGATWATATAPGRLRRGSDGTWNLEWIDA